MITAKYHQQLHEPGAQLPIGKGQRVGATCGNLSDSVYKHLTSNITKSVLFR